MPLNAAAASEDSGLATPLNGCPSGSVDREGAGFTDTEAMAGAGVGVSVSVAESSASAVAGVRRFLNNPPTNDPNPTMPDMMTDIPIIAPMPVSLAPVLYPDGTWPSKPTAKSTATLAHACTGNHQLGLYLSHVNGSRTTYSANLPPMVSPIAEPSGAAKIPRMPTAPSITRPLVVTGNQRLINQPVRAIKT